MGQPFSDLGPFEPDANLWTRINAQHAGNVTTISSKVQYFKKGRPAFYVNVYACPAFYENKNALIVATTDISQMAIVQFSGEPWLILCHKCGVSKRIHGV